MTLGLCQIPTMNSSRPFPSAPADPEDLRPLVHAELDKLPAECLEAARQLLLEMQLQQITDELDDAADQARSEGRFTPERIAQALAAHRAAHPYGR